jgi:hypothetical protein
MSEESDDQEPNTESTLNVAAAVEYGEKFEACQVTARKVLVAKKLIELAGGYKEAVILADAVWFADTDEAAGGASRADEDDAEPNHKAWVAKVRRVMAAEKLLQVASGYSEALLLLDTVVIVLRGKEGYQQMLVVRDAAAGYHDRVSAALRRRAEGE